LEQAQAIEQSRPSAAASARLSPVVLVSLVVLAAIVSMIVAVLTSAQRADEVALTHERQLVTKAIAEHGNRVLHELESAVTSEIGVRRIRGNFESRWIETRVGAWLDTFFEHDFTFIIDAQGEVPYAHFGRENADRAWFNIIRTELAPLIDRLRGRAPAAADAVPPIDGKRVSRLQSLIGRPALVAAVIVAPTNPTAASAEDRAAPIAVSVRFIDTQVLADIAARLDLRNLRRLSAEEIPDRDYILPLTGEDGRVITTVAWTPIRPGAEIVHSVVPLVALALLSFALLAGFVLSYMRRSAATIKAGETRLRHLALHDPLCGLPNRIFFGERLEAVIAQVRAGGPDAAVFCIDLDHFKDVNDTLGHPIGDELIRNVTLRLSHTMRSDDLVARLGGDEFAVITQRATDRTTLQTIANRIIASLCAPYSINGHTIVIGASIGIAVIDQRSADAADIMRYADMALYRAKNEGRSRACIYDNVMDANLSMRKQMENDLRAAIEGDALEVAYQPVVNASGETIIGVEALARWTHPVHGRIPPSEFIPVAEHSGLIVPLGEWMLRHACLDGNSWPGLTVAVNVSPLQFRRIDFVDVVERILAETGFDPKRLELEVTESTLIGNVEHAEAAMFRLKAMGVRLALDDFGTGYSSLLYLRRYPFNKLKIDTSFVHAIEKAPDAAAIVHAIVSLGRGLGMKVTAEGVETAEQHLFLRAAGVHFMQGYRFGKPMPAEEISGRLNAPGAQYGTTDRETLKALAG
jgi:diguanylate cyclase (GGDEF)-like protein